MPPTLQSEYNSISGGGDSSSDGGSSDKVACVYRRLDKCVQLLRGTMNQVVCGSCADRRRASVR